MDNHLLDESPPGDLRAKAEIRLTGPQDLANVATRAADALAALHALASAPASAADALALLHELQVHQVELDMQAEELRVSRAELEAALHRQAVLHDFQPVGCFSVDAQLVIREANLRGARMLGVARDSAPGLRFDAFFGTGSVQALRDSIASGVEQVCGPLTWCQAAVTRPAVRATTAPDPSGSGFLVALMSI